MAFKPATCPKCGGALQVPDDKETINCMYCSAKIIVREIIQVHVKVNTDNLLQLAKAAADSGNNAEAYKYYSQVLEEDGKNAEAWFGKGLAAGWTSTLANSRIQEMIVSFQKSVEYSTEADKPVVITTSADSIASVCASYFTLSHKHLMEFISVDNSWVEHLERCNQLISALEMASSLNPTEVNIMKIIVSICKNNLDGTQHWDNIQEVKVTRGVIPEHENKLLVKYNSYTQIIKGLCPDYQPPAIEKKSGACFVITAAMGDSTHPYVDDVRMIRDNVLMRSESGKWLVAFYYRYGPYLAEIISSNILLRKLSFAIVVLPLVYISRKLFRRNR